jgi:hypothetical protein
MKCKFTITALEDIGDHVLVHAQGSSDRDADWQPMRSLEFKAPTDVGSKYMIGQKLRVTIQPMKKP